MMVLTFVNSFRSEWLKTKRSLASWIVIIGGFFTSTIIVTARILNPDKLPLTYASDSFWNSHWRNSWESVAIFLLPMGVMFSTSLITQIEYKNNTWKQLHTTPVSLTTIFFSKLAVIVTMMLQFFILFNVSIYLCALLPAVLFTDVAYPVAPIPISQFLRDNFHYFVNCLPIVALQYLLSVQFRNFLVSIGSGFLIWVAAIAMLRWKWGFLNPYSYTMYYFLSDQSNNRAAVPIVDIQWMTASYFFFFIVTGYILYLNKKEKV